MSLALREWRELHEIERTVRRSDPRLAALLAIFSRLAVSDAMPGYERLPARTARLWAVVMLAAAATVRMITQTAAAAARLLDRARWRPVSAVARLSHVSRLAGHGLGAGVQPPDGSQAHPDPFHR
jgi:hypothetical protein